MELTQERLKELLSYDPLTGVFLWKKRDIRSGFERTDRSWNARYVGTEAGQVYGEPQRVRVGVDNRRYLAHRLAWLWMNGVWPSDEIDHKDMNPLNNKWENLREATHSQNGMNRKGKGKFPKGVCFHRKSGLYAARIHKDGKKFSLGYHATPEEAHATYSEAAKSLHGEFARAA